MFILIRSMGAGFLDLSACLFQALRALDSPRRPFTRCPAQRESDGPPSPSAAQRGAAWRDAARL